MFAMLTVIQAARQLGISRSKLYAMVSRREIAHYKIGTRILFTDEQIAAFLSGHLFEAGREKTADLIGMPRATGFTTLDAGRLRAAWQKQGVDAAQPGLRNAPSS